MVFLDFNLKSIIEEIRKEKNIDKETLIKVLETIIVNVVRKKIGFHADLEARYNSKLDNIEVYEFKKIVDIIINPKLELTLQKAKILNPKLTKNDIGKDLGIKININSLGRIAAQNAKQMIMQKIKEEERLFIYNEYSNRKNELVTGVVKRMERGSIIVDLGHSEGIIFCKDQISTEYIRTGDRIVAYVIDISEISPGPQIILSRRHKNLIVKLLEQEVPEVAEKIVQVRNIVRDPGFKTKILVYSRNNNIDPVGACVGLKGIRIKNIMQALKGERIEIIPFNMDPGKLVCNAIIPAEGLRVIINEKDHSMQVVVSDEQLSLAIGTHGKNIKLASKLTGWKINIQSRMKILYERYFVGKSLKKIKDITENQIQLLYNNNLKSIISILNTDNIQLSKILLLNLRYIIIFKEKIQYARKLEIEKEYKKNIILKKEIINIFLIDYFIKSSNKNFFLDNIERIPKDFQIKLKKFGYTPLGLYFEDAYNLSVILKNSINQSTFLQSIIEDLICKYCNNKLIKIKKI